MGTLSIRGVDDELAALLKEQAQRASKSVNQLVLETLKHQVGLDRPRKYTREYDDLDSLFGCWSEEEHAAIQGQIDQERVIDAELWR